MRKPNPKTVEAFGKVVNRAIQARAKGDGRPFIIVHLVTNRCMCKCKSCLWRQNQWEDVPLDDLKRFYSQAAEEGFLAAGLFGGEPFMRRDLGELMRFIKEEAGMAQLLFTNGWHLEKQMDEVLPYTDILLLSLDSAKPEKHDEIRGLNGLFDKIMKGLELVKKKYPEMPVHINTCIQKGVPEEIDDLVELTDRLGLRISFDVISDYRHGAGDSRFSQTDMGLPFQEVRGVCAYLLEKKREGAPIINSELYYKYFIDGKPGYKCHLPKMTMWVDGRGYLEYCLDLDHPIAHINDMPLKEIMELPRFKQLRKDAEDCCTCNSPTMIDLSFVWENPKLVFQQGGISVG